MHNINDVMENAGTEVKADQPSYPNIGSYGFFVDVGGLVNVLTKIRAPVRWPRRSNYTDAQKDETKWCQFHHDHGHKTEECIAVQREVTFMLNKGHLQDLLNDKGKASFDKNPSKPNPSTFPAHVKVINVISGGLDVYGLTYSATKRLARERSPSSIIPKSCRLDHEERKLEAMLITFDDDDVCDEEHHDVLFISLTISNCLLRRVLVGGGSQQTSSSKRFSKVWVFVTGT